MRPIIGITTRRKVLAWNGLNITFQASEDDYVHSVIQAGGVPILLAPIGQQPASRVVDLIDGLVLSGGGDIDPARYGGRRIESNYEIDEQRDEFEIALALEARRRLLPTLAICRGLQIVNVALGGTLIEDLPTHLGIDGHRLVGNSIHEPHQLVTLEEGCRLASIVGSQRLGVNSIHHQAVLELGRDLRIVGRTDDGVVKAIEALDPAWRLSAVQWHPELLTRRRDEGALALFHRLVDDASTASATARL